MAMTEISTPTTARRTAFQWRALMRVYERSGATRKEFCSRHGVALSTFDWWRRRLRAEATAASCGMMTTSRELIDAPPFIELVPTATPPPRVTPAAWDIELDLGTGMVLRMRRAPC